jgi:diguanylate cyclase
MRTICFDKKVPEVATMTPFEELDFEYATATAQRAIVEMAKRAVPPTPNNFSVWFNCALGNPPDLKRAVDILTKNKKKFDAATMRDLFSAYVEDQPADHAVAASEQLMSVMTAAKNFLTTAISDNRNHIQVIGSFADQATTDIDPRSLIETLVDELSKAATRASRLENNLIQATHELSTIRDSLSQAEQKAKTDTLTGLPNRRALDEFFRSSQMVAMENGKPLSVLLIDIDHFKKFNDTFGHGVGDQVLRLIANLLREQVREGDLPARHGGEELIAVLPGANLAACQLVAERIRSSIAECRMTRRSTGEVLPSVTVSIGVGEFRYGESMAELIERCDRALYGAKAAGRNCVVTETGVEVGWPQAEFERATVG